MGTFQDDIQQKLKEIELHRSDLYTLYADLGFSIALVEKITPLGCATSQFNRFMEVASRYEEAQQTYERIKLFISQLEDRSRKIEQIEADIKALQEQQKSLHARLGAMAYEAFGSGSLPDHLHERCTPLFADHHHASSKLQAALKQCQAQKGSLAHVQCKILTLRLQHSRKQLVPLLMKAGALISSLDLEAEVGRGSLIPELARCKKQEHSLQQELDIHHSAVAKLRSEEKVSPRNQLESSRIHFKEMEKQRMEASYLYGKALYENLGEKVSTNLIGSGSMALVEQITLHSRRIARLEKDIIGLQNLMKVEELEAQIELENQKILHLRTQIEQSNKQISQVEFSIARKRDKIRSLSPRKLVHDHE